MLDRISSRRFRILVLAFALWLPMPASARPAVVILVRHGEKQTVPPGNPALTAAGQSRADELARVVAAWTAAGGKLRAIFASDLRRTQQTIAPLAKASHMEVTVVGSKDTATLVQEILAVDGGIVVVAGHTSTIPGIVKALGGPPDVAIDEDQFSFFFVLTDPGSPHASLVVMRYGQ
jgi:phosphohistidine phosphatase SixA